MVWSCYKNPGRQVLKNRLRKITGDQYSSIREEFLTEAFRKDATTKILKKWNYMHMAYFE